MLQKNAAEPTKTGERRPGEEKVKLTQGRTSVLSPQIWGERGKNGYSKNRREGGNKENLGKQLRKKEMVTRMTSFGLSEKD